MSASLDSRAYFHERAFGMLAGAPHDFDTMGRFAFASSYCPGSGGDKIFVDDVVTPIWGDQANAKKIAARQLFFEAYTLVATDMKARVERTDDDPPKKMPKIERETRLDDVKGWYGSLRIEDDKEPGPALIDMFNQMGTPIIGMIENMSTHICSQCGHEEHVFGHGGVKSEAEKLGVPLLAEIPLHLDIRMAADGGAPIVVSKPDSAQAQAFRTLATALIEVGKA